MRTCAGCGTANPDEARFCLACGERFAAVPVPRRRFVVALFCDLVGSTELAEGLDPEVLRAILDGYFAAMRSAVGRHGGTVEKFIGDAVVATFGIPEAHEDDGSRAIRAALDMREAVARLEGIGDRRLSVRIAVAAGEAFADDLSPRDGRVGGDVFNTAARLQAAGAPDEILATAAVVRLIRGGIRSEPLPPIAVKGKAQPIDAVRVLGLRPAASRPPSRLVGRERALASLHGALEDAVDGRSCVLVTVLAPAGVGKSRLASAFAERLEAQATVLGAQTPAYGEGVTFAPLLELLAAAAGVAVSDGAGIARALADRLASQADGDAIADRLAQLLGVREAVVTEASWAVRRLVEVLAADRPVVLVVDDLQWAETPMLDLLDAVIDRVRGPVVVLCLARPDLLERRPTWGAGKSRALTTTLPALPPPDARRLAEGLLGGAPEGVIEAVCERAEGNPLFLEQLAAMLEDAGQLEAGRWTGGSEVSLEIPASVQALLAARVDRLEPDARAILERASVEGRRFRMSVVRALAPDGAHGAVADALAAAERRGLIAPEDDAADRWRFAHALIADTVYRGLSKATRAELHERLAAWLLEHDADRPDVDESAAHHLERALHLREELGQGGPASAELAERAGVLYASAGSRAFASIDLLTARELLGRASRLLPEASPRRLELLPSLGVALTETGHPAETEALLARAVVTARAAGSERDALRARLQLLSNWVYRTPTDADIDAAAAEARAAAETLAALGDHVGQSEAAIVVEYLAWMRGDLEAYVTWALAALRFASRAGRPREIMQGVADVVQGAIAGPLPVAEFQRIADVLHALDSTPLGPVSALALRAVISLVSGDDARFQEQESAWRAVIEREGVSWLGASHALTIAAAETWSGRPAAAERRLRDARESFVGMGDIWWLGTIDALLCEALAAQSLDREFLAQADAFLASDPVPDRDVRVRLRIEAARVALLRGSPPDAEIAARDALALADGTSLVLARATAYLVLADALVARERVLEARAAREAAIDILRAKGFAAAVERLAVTATT